MVKPEYGHYQIQDEVAKMVGEANARDGVGLWRYCAASVPKLRILSK